MTHTQNTPALETSPDLEAFLAQNPIAAATLGGLEAPDPFFANHHAGGLYVLIYEIGTDRYVKMHDSWGDEDTVVVHIYSTDAEAEDTVIHYATGAEAYKAFLEFSGGA